MSLLLLVENYKYNDIIIKIIALGIIIVDMYHLKLSNIQLFTIIIIIFIIVRQYREPHYDDIHPNIEINYNYLEKSKILFVIPKYNGDSILNYPNFIKYIKEYSEKNNKILGLHGYMHRPEGYIKKAEFGYNNKEKDILDAINIFETAFGYKSKYFKAPFYNLHPDNKLILKKHNITICGPSTMIFNKLFHRDSDMGITIFNKINLII